MENKRILKLIAQAQLSVISEEEQKELNEWIESSPLNRLFYDQFTNDEELNDKDNGKFSADASWKRFEQEYYGTVSVNKPKWKWWRNRYAIAASILLPFLVGRIVWKYYSFSAEKVAASKNKKEAELVSISTIMNFSPIGDKATLILPNGLTVDLDSLQIGDSVLAENRYIKKIGDDKLKIANTAVPPLISENKNGSNSEVLYAALNVPGKKKYQLILSDGTLVWLNEFSSFRFPMGFDLNSRDVALAGEAYFEVMSIKDKAGKVPFVVKTRKMNVNVLGTHFNVNAYDTALNVRTTLIEGKIQVIHEGKVNIMLPGQQARLTRDGVLSIKAEDNPKEEIAWANNLEFQDRPLQEILQEVGQIYNVEFSFECCESEQYTIILKRDMSLSEAMETMEGLREFYFVPIGKKIVVKKGVFKKKENS